MKRTVWGPEEERVPFLALRTQLEFQEIVQAETTPQGRRMIDWWATPADVPTLDGLLDLEADRRLDQTLALMWRTPAA